MKKLIALILCIVLAFAVTGCGASGEQATTDKLNAYLATVQEQVNATAKATEEQGMKISVAAKDASMVYTFQFLEDISDVPLLKSMLESGLEQTSSTYLTSLEKMKEKVPGAKSIIVEYTEKNGSLIYSKEFK